MRGGPEGACYVAVPVTDGRYARGAASWSAVRI